MLKKYQAIKPLLYILLISVFSITLCSCINEGTTPNTSANSFDEKTDDLDYTVKDGGAVITHYKGSGGAVVIPDTIDGFPVKEIGNEAFSYAELITSIEMPDTVESIGVKAFYGCSSLKNVKLPSQLKFVGGFAFEHTAWLNEQTDDFVIGGDGVLIYYQGDDHKITVPSGVKSIGGAFYNSYSITEITLPSTLENLADNAFYTCTLMRNISIENSKTYKSENGTLYSFDGKKLIYSAPQKNDTSITIPDGVIEICDYAFANNSHLEMVTFPQTLELIGKYAFDYCKGLKNISIPNNVKIVGEYAFSLCEKLESVILSNSMEKILKGTFNSCTSLKSVQIPSNIRQIESKAFYYCTALENAQIPETASTAQDAFEGCDKLKFEKG